VTAEEVFERALLHLRRSGGGWLSGYLSLWLEPEQYIHCWFAGENHHLRVWDFRVAPADVERFLAAVPRAERHAEYAGAGGSVYRVRADRADDPLKKEAA
jgi:hypothetical protein